MIYPFLFVGLPFLIGSFLGYFLAWYLVISLAGMALALGLYLLWSTKDAELGGLVGVFAMVIALSFIIGLAISTGFVYAWSMDLSWLLRPGALNAN